MKKVNFGSEILELLENWREWMNVANALPE